MGAAVLVALGVWLIPWVLDGPETAPAEAEPGIELPPVEEAAPIRTETVELDRAPRPEPPAEQQDRPAEQAVALVAPPAPAGDGGADGPAGQQSSSEPAAHAGGGPSGPAASAGGGSAGPAASAGGGPSAPAAAAGGWLVQLGSFGELGNAERLANRVSAFGYAASVSAHSAGGRELHRVRVGGFASRNEAEAAVTSLLAHGFVAQVVAPE